MNKIHSILNGPQYVGETRGLTSLSQFLGLYSRPYRASSQVPNVAFPLERDLRGKIAIADSDITNYMNLICQNW
jgi:hypothetical protein